MIDLFTIFFAGVAILFFSVAVLVMRQRDRSYQLSAWLAHLCDKGGVFENPQVDQWTDEWLASASNESRWTRADAYSVLDHDLRDQS